MTERAAIEAIWSNAVQTRDASYNGRFVYAVRSTGIFCRPSCPSRRPKPENMSFYATPAEAQAAGYRACRRCQPLQTGDVVAEAVTMACRRLEASITPLSLAVLADAAGYSPYHFHRLFKTATGLTPRGYWLALRARNARASLKEENNVTAAIYAAGFNSSGRFYETSNSMLGMTPGAFKQGGKDIVIQYAMGVSSLGHVLVARSKKGVCAILLGDDQAELLHELEGLFPKASLADGGAEFSALTAAVIAFAESPGRDLALPLDIQGTAFQERVWRQLRTIPLGQTASYAEIAQAIGEPLAVRAVARACAANRLALAIPCHRVVRSDGSLAGYRWGQARKEKLLARERKADS